MSGIVCATLSETSYKGVNGEEFSVINYHDDVYEIESLETGDNIYYVERSAFNESFSFDRDSVGDRLINVKSVPLNRARANEDGDYTTLGRAGKIFDVGSEFELREIQDGRYILLDLEDLEFYSVYPVNIYGYFKPVKRSDTFDRCQIKDISLDELKIEIRTVEFESLDDFIERARVLSMIKNTIVTFNVHNDSGIINRYVFDSGHKFHRSYLDNINLKLDFNTNKLVITTKYNVALNDFPMGCKAIVNTISLKTNMTVTFEPNLDGYYVLTLVGKGVGVSGEISGDVDTTKWLLSTLEHVRLRARDFVNFFSGDAFPDVISAIKRCNDIENSGHVDSIPILDYKWEHRMWEF